MPKKLQPGIKVIVLHDYTPPKDHCLRLTVGDIITVVNSKNQDTEWVAGKNSAGKIGFFPALYVEIVKTKIIEQTKTPPPPPSTSHITTKQAAMATSPSSQPIQPIQSKPIATLQALASPSTPSVVSQEKSTSSNNEHSTSQSPPQQQQQQQHYNKPHLQLNRTPSHRKKHSIGSVPSPRWLAPAHLTTVALFKYFADGHFGFDDEGDSSSSSIFKKRATLRVADLLKFGKKPIKVPLHRRLWSSDLEARSKLSTNQDVTTNMVVKAKQTEIKACDNFKTIMRYMGDLETDSSAQYQRDHRLTPQKHQKRPIHESTVNLFNTLERDGFRSKILQLGLNCSTFYDTSKSNIMCDEIWCQLIKQTTSNPNHDSLVAGWELIVSIASVFKPSIQLFPCVFQFVHDRCYEVNEIGALAVHTLRQLQNKREDDVHTPSARHQANLISSSELRTIAQTPLPLNVFGASIEEANRLELFVKEVVDYRQSITELQQRSKQLHNDPAMNNVNNGDRSSDATNSMSDGSEVFGSVTKEDIELVTTGCVMDLKSVDDKKYRTRYCWVPETLDTFCWTRGTERNENKFKSIPLSNFEEAIREPPSCGYKSNNKTNNPYLYFTLKSSDSNGSKHKNDSMDLKTATLSECEKWVHALRELLKTCTGNQKRRIRMAADEAGKYSKANAVPQNIAVRTHQSIHSLANAFKVVGCGQKDVDGIYNSVRRTKNGARLYMSDNGYVLSREIIDRKAGWIIGKNQIALYGTAESSKTSSTSKGSMNGLRKTKSNNSDMFEPPTVGWKEFEGKSPAPKVSETGLSKRTSSMASMAASAARVRLSPRTTTNSGNGGNGGGGTGGGGNRSSLRVSMDTSEVQNSSGEGICIGVDEPHTLRNSIVVPDHELFVPLLIKLLCRAIKVLGGYESEGIFRLAGNRKKAEALRKTVSKGDYNVLWSVGDEDETGLEHDLVQGNRHMRHFSTASSSIASNMSSLSSSNSMSTTTSSTTSESSTNSGTPNRKKKKKNQIELRDCDVAADLLKQWLRAMPEPLIAYNCYSKAIEAGSEHSLEKGIAVLHALDIERRQTLMYLLQFLYNVSLMEKKTKMGCMQLAIVFVPNVIKSPDLDINPSLAIINMNPEKDFLTMLITNYKEIAKKVGR